MPLTPATLAAEITAMLAAYKLYDEEFQDWLSGTVGGGVLSDGKYPLTSRLTGEVRQTICPAQLEDNVTGAVGQAQTAQTAAEAAKTAAETAETNAQTAETNALAHKTAAVAAQSAAEAAQAAAENAEVNAIAQAANAAASYDAFDDRYLGVFTTALEPALDNDGDALVAGALYWNSDDTVFKVWTGAAWSTAFDLDLTSNLTFSGTVSFTGTFTSLGIDDNATAERFQVSDNNIVFGPQSAVGGSFDLFSGDDTGRLIFSGGSNGGTGANMLLHGSTHATAASDMILRAGTNTWMQWDESFGRLLVYTGVGAKTLALTIDSSQDATIAGDIALGSNGLGDTVAQFYDDLNNTYRSIFWDSSAESFYFEDKNGTFKKFGTGSGSDFLLMGA